MTMNLSPQDSLISELVADLRPMRRLSRLAGLAIFFSATAVTVLIAVSVIGMRSDILAGHFDPMFILSSGLFLMLALASSFTVIEMSRPYVGGHRDGWIWAVAMAALLPVSAIIISAADYWQGEGLKTDMSGAVCTAWGVMFSLIAGGALTLLLRRGAPTSPERAGLLSGVAAGSVGIFAETLHCPFNDIVHIGLWHGLAVIVSAGIGRMVVPRLCRW
jgi:hypothetical protein